MATKSFRVNRTNKMLWRFDLESEVNDNRFESYVRCFTPAFAFSKLFCTLKRIYILPI